MVICYFGSEHIACGFIISKVLASSNSSTKYCDRNSFQQSQCQRREDHQDWPHGLYLQWDGYIPGLLCLAGKGAAVAWANQVGGCFSTASSASADLSQ